MCVLQGVGGRTVHIITRIGQVGLHCEFATVRYPLVLRIALAGTVAMRGERIPLPLERNPFVVLVHCTEAATNGTENTHL